MSTFEQKHPEPVRRAVGNAIADGRTPAAVRRELAAGTLPNYPHAYEMPLETVRYYGKQEKKKRAATQLSPRVKADAGGTVDYLARSLLTAAEEAIDKLRRKPVSDPKALKEWGDVLKVLSPLVKPEPAQEPGTRKRSKPPADPLTQALTTAANEPVPTPNRREGTNDNTGAENNATQPDTEPPSSAGLPQELAESVSWPPVSSAS